jgi:23S rRNA (uracil1939-C5)-methyltransferase
MIKQRKSRPPQAEEEEAILVIESVGVRGDGIARRQGMPVYVPLTAPGDRVRVRLGPARGEGRAGEIAALLSPGERAAPVCPHFGACGGCSLQHLSVDAYVRAKETQVAGALRQHGVQPVEMRPLRRLAPGTRRRARFAVHRASRPQAAALVGFNARSSHRIVDMRACAVLDPAVFALVEAVRRIAPALWAPGAAGALTATRCDAGLDVLVDLAAMPDRTVLEGLADFAAEQDLARLAWRVPGSDEEATPVALRRPPRIVFSGVAVDLPVDSFLQASVEAEALLVAEVLGGLGGAGPVLDLYAGLGTFTFALARTVAVHAVDRAPLAVAALQRAAARAGLAGRVTGERRDIEACPLRADELARFAAVVLDPPRAGARAQCAALAASGIGRIVAVSCNPATFARDARLLVDGGFRLRRVAPIDQFVWSPHVELVAHFERSGG